MSSMNKNNRNKKDEVVSSSKNSSMNNSAADAPPLDKQMNDILSLIMSKTRGDGSVTDETIENAVTSLLKKEEGGGGGGGNGDDRNVSDKNDATSKANHNTSTTTATVTSQQRKQRQRQQHNPTIEVDDDEYDDLPPASKAEAEEKKDDKISSEKSNNQQQTKKKVLTVESIRKQISEKDNNNNSNNKAVIDSKLYEHIPLGRAGAQMLVTFGDGKKPNPNAVQEALLGTRQCLLYAIKDARALRRSERQEYLRARVLVKHYNVNATGGGGSFAFAVGGGRAGKSRKSKSRLRKEDYAYLTKIIHTDNETTSTTSDNGKTTTAATTKPKNKKVVINANNISDHLFADDVDHNMLYRAMAGYDKLSYDVACGFDIDQLQSLFPEEMNAYERWNQMQKKAQKDRDEEQTKKEQLEEQQEQEDEKEEAKKDDDKKDDAHDGILGGHLNERLEQFDIRTNLMNREWYMKFADIRKGSFLPRQASGKDAKEWEYKRKQQQQSGGFGVKGKRSGRPKTDNDTISWDKYKATYVAFLRWIGFGHVRPNTINNNDEGNGDKDDDSSDNDKNNNNNNEKNDCYYYKLLPPNTDTTEALGFLAHDFLGRIVEKAIYLRNVDNKKNNNNSSSSTADNNNNSNCPLLELKDGEQLDADDIKRAMNDSTIRPVSLYSSGDTDDVDSSNKHHHTIGTQLYFGPGFEDRLEIELDEMVGNSSKKKKVGSSQISKEEISIRKREDEIFKRLISSQAPFSVDEGLYKDLGPPDEEETGSDSNNKGNEKKDRDSKDNDVNKNKNKNNDNNGKECASNNSNNHKSESDGNDSNDKEHQKEPSKKRRKKS